MPSSHCAICGREFRSAHRRRTCSGPCRQRLRRQTAEALQAGTLPAELPEPLVDPDRDGILALAAAVVERARHDARSPRAGDIDSWCHHPTRCPGPGHLTRGACHPARACARRWLAALERQIPRPADATELAIAVFGGAR